jgi:hypothetical protein
MTKRTAALVSIAIAALAAGLYFGWSALTALGLTTFIISLLPCVAMCALGICASRMGTKTPEHSTDATRKETP